MTNVLVLNSGSSSLKFALIEVESDVTLASGSIDRIGERLSHTRITLGGESREADVSIADHTEAVRVVLGALERGSADDLSGADAQRISAVGHRVVHGGDLFFEATPIDDAVVTAIDELSALAPLHNPANLAGIRAAREAFPDIPHIAVFDTAFHQSMPPEAYTYAIDRDVAEQYAIRRYGFHGTSHESASRAAASLLKRPLEELKQVILHLGNGASMTAIDAGRSIDTSMGMSPLAGLVMGTRSGDIDPAVNGYLSREAGMTAAEVDQLLNKQSGMFGLTGHTDMRDVLAAADAGDQDALLALDVYVHRIRHYLGAYLLELGGVDVITFTGGVGEHEARIRARILADLEWLGIELDPELNAAGPPTDTGNNAILGWSIGAADAPVAVLVIPADEEREIARQTLGAISAR